MSNTKKTTQKKTEKTKTEFKICVYAICKNESQWIERWIDNVSDADYIVVLDTGSTDDSLEKLQKDPRVTRVEQKIINPWRFDEARNESMKLAPEDTDIFVCTDFDEIFEDGWCQVLREFWRPEFNRCYYTYAWSHNSLGEPQDVFKYDKIHTKDYHWIFPVHEVLSPNDPELHEQVLDVGDRIYLHHLQDPSKERSNYFDLLQLSVKENPENSHCQMLLAREYLIRNDFDNALTEYLKCSQLEDIKVPNRVSVLLETYGRLGDLYFWHKQDFNQALSYYHEFIKIDPTYREPYFCIAEIYNNTGLPTVAIGYMETALKFCHQHYNWVERKDNWIAKDAEILFYSYALLNQFEIAATYGKKAVEHNPNNNQLLLNYVKVLEAIQNKTEQEKEQQDTAIENK